jgi:hypothetical protein
VRRPWTLAFAALLGVTLAVFVSGSASGGQPKTVTVTETATAVKTTTVTRTGETPVPQTQTVTETTTAPAETTTTTVQSHRVHGFREEEKPGTPDTTAGEDCQVGFTGPDGTTTQTTVPGIPGPCALLEGSSGGGDCSGGFLLWPWLVLGGAGLAARRPRRGTRTG